MHAGVEIERKTIVRQDAVERPVLLIQDGVEYHDEVIYLAPDTEKAEPKVD